MTDLPNMSSRKFQDGFLTAVANGDVKQVKKLLAFFDSLDFKTWENGYTALHLAVLNQHLQILEILLSHDTIDINARAYNGDTPLCLAIEEEFYEGCVQLVQAGADVNLTTNRCFVASVAPLHLAAGCNDTKILDFLLSQDNINVNVRKSNGETPLISAVRKNSFEAVALLVESRADLNAKYRGAEKLEGDTLDTALHIAVENDNHEILQYLAIQPSIQFEIRSRAGHTPLFLAVKQKKYKATEILIQNGADVNVSGNCIEEESLLQVAVNNRDLGMLKMLLWQGQPKINIKNQVTQQILFYAAAHNNYAVLKCLLEAGAEVNFLYDNGQSPLHASISHPQSTHLLIKHGADIEACDYYSGNTALHKAVLSGCLETVCMLLYHNADVNSKNALGWTPFMCSFTNQSNGSEQLQDILFDYNSTFHSCDSRNGVNLISLALKYNPRYFTLFLEKGMTVSANAFVACITSRYPNENFFKIVWDRLKYCEIHPISLTMLFIRPGLTPEMIKKFLNIIIESSNIDLLLSCTTTPSRLALPNLNDNFYGPLRYFSDFSFARFIDQFKRAQFDIELLMKLLFRLLENSYKLTPEVITRIYSCYGDCELIKLLRYQECEGNWDSFNINGPLLRIFFDIHRSVRNIRNDFLEKCDLSPINKSQYGIKTYLAYCADREMMSKCGYNFSEDVMPGVPKLTELARNTCREFIVKAFHVRTACQYYTIVDDLKIARLHKKILKFEQELYQVE